MAEPLFDEPLFDVVMVTEPEVVMPSDTFPPGVLIVAIGEAVGGEARFGSVADLLAARATIEAGKTARVEAWQAAIVPPAWVVRRFGDVTIYGRLFSWRETAAKELSLGASWNEVDVLRVRTESALSRGWLFGYWTSTLEPAGELGHCHRADIAAVITADQYRRAALDLWPPEVPGAERR